MLFYIPAVRNLIAPCSHQSSFYLHNEQYRDQYFQQRRVVDTASNRALSAEYQTMPKLGLCKQSPCKTQRLQQNIFLCNQIWKEYKTQILGYNLFFNCPSKTTAPWDQKSTVSDAIEEKVSFKPVNLFKRRAYLLGKKKSFKTTLFQFGREAGIWNISIRPEARWWDSNCFGCLGQSSYMG